MVYILRKLSGRKGDPMSTRYKTARLRSRLTIQEVADALGVHRNAIYKWEHGKAKPRSDNLMALANLYGCAPEYLTGIELRR